MRHELLRPEEVSKKTPDSLCILAHFVTRGGISDIVALATVAARLERTKKNKQIGLGYVNNEVQPQAIQLLSLHGINFHPFPERLFDPYVFGWDRVRYFHHSWQFRNELEPYTRIALLGAKEARFVRKSLLRFRLDPFPKNVFSEDQPLVDNYASQLAEEYCLPELDYCPVEFSIPPNAAVFRWFITNQLNPKPLSFGVINLGAGSAPKTWPAERFFTIGEWVHQKTETPIVFINPPPSFSQREQVAGFVETRPWAYLFQSAIVGETADLVQRARWYMGGDTGFTHIAAAIGKPLVAIYPEVNLRVWKPVTKHQKMIIVSEETIESITCNQVIRRLEACSNFLQNQGGQP